MRTTIQKFAKILKEHHLTIAVAESITCGYISHKLGSIRDTSEIFMGSIICYNEKVKTKLLKVKKSMIKQYTCESQEVTDALVISISKRIPADIHGAITGLANRGASETKSKPVGTVFYAFLFRGKLFRLKKKFNGSPMEIKQKATEHFFKFIIKKLTK